MKPILLLLTFLTLFTAGKVSAVTRADAAEQSARLRALDILQRAFPRELAPGNSPRNLIVKISQRLSQAKLFYVANAENLPDCRPGRLAFVYLYRRSPEIYLCERYLTLTPTQKAQTLIHEATHLAGVHDECEVTRLEVETMTASGEGLTYRNSYVRSCGIEVDF